MSKATTALLRGAQRLKTDFRVGSKLEGFVVKQVFPVKEFDLVAFHLEHEHTKARYVHVDCDDTNNVFSVVFRTPATDSSGLPHILEHTVLCGSERFPVRDPFFNMTKRSLNTFMNAMTAADHTMYPFATRNEQDFENLMRVYLDATLFPKLERMDFLQEGHRLEPHPEDPNQIIRTGVVYNEMKGTLGSAATTFNNKVNQTLYAGTQYANISGGDPKFIPDLTHEGLVAYHRKHYHPSNALFFTYGDLPMASHLKLLNEFALERFSFSQEAADVKNGIATSHIDTSSRPAPGELVRLKGPLEPMLDKQGTFAMARTASKEVDNRRDEYSRLVGRILSTLLTDGPSAPLYASLIDSQLAPDFAPGSGIDTISLHPTIAVGVQGIDPTEDAVREVRQAVEDCLRQVAASGLDERRVRAVLHQLELSLKQKGTTFGLAVLYAFAGAFAHCPDIADGDLINALNDTITLDAKIQRLRDEMKANPKFWQDQVVELFFDQDRETGSLTMKRDFVSFLMEPDEQFVSKLADEERSKLAQLTSTLTQADIENIARTADELAEMQAKEQDVSCLPTLRISDVPRIPEEQFTVDPIDGNNLFWVNDQQTNGIVYFRNFFDISDLPQDYIPLLGLFSTLLGSVDTEIRSYQDLSVEADLICDGMTFSPSLVNWHVRENMHLLPASHTLLESDSTLWNSLSAVPVHGPLYRQGIMVSSCALERNLDATIALMGEILTQSLFDKSFHHIESLLATNINAASSNITNGALGYARKWAVAPLGDENIKREALAGLTQIDLLMKCAENLDTLLPVFKDLTRFIFRPERMSTCVVAGGSQIDKEKVLRSIRVLGQRLGENCGTKPELNNAEGLPSFGVLDSVRARSGQKPTYIPLPISVHNAAVTVPTAASFGSADDASMMVLGQVMSTNYLHRLIRERGGAYGGGSSHDLTGLFSFYSYYDPQAEDTVKTFGNAMQWACEGSFSDRDVEEALLSVFGSIDAPQEVRTKGSGPFLYGISPSDRQGLRDRFFAVSKASVVDAAQRHFGPLLSDGRSPTQIFLEEPLKGCVAVAGNADTPLRSSAWEKKVL